MKQALIILLLIFISCGPGKFSIQSIETGSNLDARGAINQEFLTFTFSEPSKKRNVQDLFNHIYFAGDTLCFSLKYTGKVKKEEISISFVNPATGESFKAERIDVQDNYISGFSLVGTVLEKFYKNDLLKRIPQNKYCCKQIPFQLRIEIMGSDKFVNSITSGSFRLKYNEESKVKSQKSKEKNPAPNKKE